MVTLRASWGGGRRVALAVLLSSGAAGLACGGGGAGSAPNPAPTPTLASSDGGAAESAVPAVLPDTVGWDGNRARAELEGLGLLPTVRSAWAKNEGESGLVVAQEPNDGRVVTRFEPVIIEVARAKTMPPLTDECSYVAHSMLFAELGTPATQVGFEPMPGGLRVNASVEDTRPRAGEALYQDDEITLLLTWPRQNSACAMLCYDDPPYSPEPECGTRGGLGDPFLSRLSSS
ncbi:MAG: PASTA domain-containing protein [Acidimicrobiia bacterium]